MSDAQIKKQSIVVNDILFSKVGNMVTVASQGNWFLNGKLEIPEVYRPKAQALLYVHKSEGGDSMEIIAGGTTEYSTSSYEYLFSTWITND